MHKLALDIAKRIEEEVDYPEKLVCLSVKHVLQEQQPKIQRQC